MLNPNSESNVGKPMKLHFIEECVAMLKYLSAEGKVIPKIGEKILEASSIPAMADELSSREVLLLHKQLSTRILPAKPKTVFLLCEESRKGFWTNLLGPVRLVRSLMVTTLISLGVFVSVVLSSMVSAEHLADGILNNSGIDLLVNIVFILASAALGGCFSALYQINKYINNGTYDPKYESSYWIRLLLGIISGLVLAVIIPVAADLKFANGNATPLTIPLLAMLGGFSATLVFRILNRIVWAVESLFVGKQEDTQERKLLNQKSLFEQEKIYDRSVFAQKLQVLKKDLSANKTNDEIHQRIDDLLESINDDN